MNWYFSNALRRRGAKRLGARPMQFHVLSFEGPDPYARAGGIASRVDGLTRCLAHLGFETHLWFVGDPDLPGHDAAGSLHLHRWCQWISRFHPGGVYDGEEGKRSDYASSLAPFLLRETLIPHLKRGRRAVVLAEEWHTAPAVLHLDHLLRREGLRARVSLIWNANNTFGFDRIDWQALSQAATITTVSRYMKHLMWDLGVDPIVIPNGLADEAFSPPEQVIVRRLRKLFRRRALLAKVARFDPDKRWIMAMGIARELKRRGARPLLIARGGLEAHGHEVMTAAAAEGLRVVERAVDPGPVELLKALASSEGADVLHLRSPLDAPTRSVLFRSADAVLANSGREPFGLVGLEAMAAGGVACTGCSGEDYAVPGWNALVLQTADPLEFVGLFAQIRSDASAMHQIRSAGRATALRYAWPEVIRRVLFPRVHLIEDRGEHFDVDATQGARGRSFDAPPPST